MGSRLEEHRTGMGLLGTTAALLAAAGSVLFLVLGTSAQVSAPGMEPGLLPGDRVYVLTSAYGRREPRPGEVAAMRRDQRGALRSATTRNGVRRPRPLQRAANQI